MKRIAHVSKNLSINGISSVILNYSEKIVSDDCSIDIFAGDPINSDYLLRCQQKNIKIIKTPPKRGKNPIAYFWFLKKKLKDYDIVHIHGNSRTILLELLIAKINKNKIKIAHSHNINCDFKFVNWLFNKNFSKYYDIGLACSKEAGEWMFCNNEFIILPNGIDTNKYIFNSAVRNEIRDKLGLKDKFVIGHVGNFSDQKNYPFIIKVFEEVLKKNDEAVLLLIGDYNNNLQLKNKILNGHNSEKIILYGTSNNVYDLYNAMDVFLFPSKYEGLGIVLLEAQCSGLNCYVSSVVPRDVVLDSSLVHFIDLNDEPTVWANKINRFKKVDRKGNFYKNKNKIQLYDINSNITKLKKIYKL